MPHQSRQVGLPRVQNEVVVVAHQAVGQHLRIEAVRRLRQHGQQSVPVVISIEDRLAPIAARSHVIDGTGKLDAQWAGHGPTIRRVAGRGKT